MHENYLVFPETSGGLTHPIHRIRFPSCRFCDPESFPLTTLRENELWWMLTACPAIAPPLPLHTPHPPICLTQQFACIQSTVANSSTQKTGDTELSWDLSFEIFACYEGALFDYFLCAFIFGEWWAVLCFTSLWKPNCCWGAVGCGMGSYLVS